MRKLNVIFLLMILCSCGESANEESYYRKVVPVEYQRSVRLSNLIDTTINYIPLQSQSTPLLGAIHKLQITDTLIFALDNIFLSKVLIFSLNGKYVKPVGAFGEAEGEYSSPSDFTLSNNFIEIYDRKKRVILKYFHDGTYLKEFRIPFLISEMEFEQEGKRWVYTPEDGLDFIAEHTLYLVDSTYSDITKEFFPYKNGLDDVPFPNYLIKNQNGIRFTRPLVGEFYSLEAQSGIDSLIHVDYSPYNWSYTEDELSINDERIEGDFYKGGVMSVAHELCETSDYLVFRTFKVDEGEQRERINEEEDLWLCIYHKKADKLIAVKEIINDLDSTLFAPPIYAHEDQFYGVLYPEELLQNHAGKVISDGTMTIAVDSLSMEQNPILVKYTFNDKLFYQ